ncbi:MAG: cellulase family glycosylhydrolase [Anaerolineae bacterium]
MLTKASLLFLFVLAVSACAGLTPPQAQYSLAFASDREGNGEVYLLGRDGSLRNLTNHLASDWDPTWSPDGRRLAFTSHRDGNSEIYSMDASGRNLANLTEHPAWDYAPAWSPDGTTIAFVSERGGGQAIYVMQEDGGNVRRLTDERVVLDHRSLAWSPDGQHLAFSAVREGIRGIYIIEADGSGERALTTRPLLASTPAWSPDGEEIAFVGWREGGAAGIFIIKKDGSDPRQLFQSPAWLGSLTWSPDGEWLLFTWRQEGNHELYAIRRNGSDLRRITDHPAWDDFPVVYPLAVDFTPPVSLSPPCLSLSRPEEGYGASLADPGKAHLLRDMGFTWAKGFISWNEVEAERSRYDWQGPDSVVEAYAAQELDILLRVHLTPAWARPSGTTASHPPTDARYLADFMRALAGRYQGRVAAYEIWNEPNLRFEWGGSDPDPVWYTALLKAAYQAVKDADPAALVVSGGLATTGTGSPRAMGDLAYLEEIYQAGAGDYFDALGSHPYAFGHDPDYEDYRGLSFSRVVAQRYVMLAYGDASKPVWITELGWPLETSWDLGEHGTYAVSEANQAQYLARAYEKTRQEWPWVGPIFLFNLDFSTVPWYPAAEIMRWYAVLNPDGSPRQAYTRLKALATGTKCP